MLATLTISGSGPGLDPDGMGAQGCGRSARRRSLCSRAILVAAQQLLAEMVVDRRVGAAAGRAGERDGARGWHPSGAGSSSGLAPMKAASGVPQQKQKQEENCSRIAPEEGCRIVGGPRR